MTASPVFVAGATGAASGAGVAGAASGAGATGAASAVFEETHRLGQRPWFWGYVGAGAAVALVQGDFLATVALVAFAALAGASGYRVRLDAAALWIDARGAMRVLAVFAPAVWARLQSPASRVEAVEVRTARAPLRWMAWPAVGLFPRSRHFLGFGAPFLARVQRRRLGVLRIGIRDAPTFRSAAAALLAGDTAPDAGTATPRPAGPAGAAEAAPHSSPA